MELFHRAAKLGNTKSYYNIGMAAKPYYSIGNSYIEGNGVYRGTKRRLYYWELAAIGGHVKARHNLGCFEEEAGNMDRALKHYIIAAGYGDNDSLEMIKLMFMNGNAMKGDYAKVLRVHTKQI